jgi:UDP-N-acetylmuramoyl-L-alanyl-D-glutamate--2,6-diaminopimelate ligase
MRAVAKDPPDRRKAIKLAIETAKPEDAVLVAGKGHEPYQIIGTKKFDFIDRQEARSCLRARLLQTELPFAVGG